MSIDTSWTPLFSGIVAASIWSEPYHVRLVWITLLAIKDRNGMVASSVPGLARLANVSRSECENALKKFESPDLDSKCQDDEGRKIKRVDGGWLILGHVRNQEKMMGVCKNMRNAARQARFRAKHPDGCKPKMSKTTGEVIAEQTGTMPNDEA